MTPPAALAADPASTRSTATRRSAPTREPLHAEAAPLPAPAPAAAASATHAPTHTPPAQPVPTSAPAPRPLDIPDAYPWDTTALSAPPLDASSPPAASASPESITPMQRWAHELVLQIIQANIPPEALAIQFGIPFATLISYLNLPEVQAEINAYEELLTLRTRLLGHAARPISLRKLLDVLQSPAPRPTRHDPEADQRALHRHAELIRRTATTIARESRAKRSPSASEGVSNGTANVSDVSERTTSTDSVGRATGCLPASANSNSPEPSHAHGIASVSEGASAPFRTANVSERTSSSDAPLPSQPVHPAGALPDLPPASSLKDDADSTPLTDADSPNAEDALGCASPDAVDARRQKPTGSTDPVTPSPSVAQSFTSPAPPSPAVPLPIAHSPLPSPSDPSFLSPPRSSASSAFNNSASPLRNSDPSAASAFSSRSRHARDRPAA